MHFINRDLYISKRVQEIGTASLTNYLSMVSNWFRKDLSRYNFFLMPISFCHSFEAVKSVSTSTYDKQMQNFLQYIEDLEKSCPNEEEGGCRVTTIIKTNLMKSKDADALPFQITGDPSAPKIQLQEEDIRASFPDDFEKLTNRLKERYIDFKQNSKYHSIRKTLEENPKYCRTRFLDPQKSKGIKKSFYSSEILKEFDKHYNRK